MWINFRRPFFIIFYITLNLIQIILDGDKERLVDKFFERLCTKHQITKKKTGGSFIRYIEYEMYRK